MENLYVFAVVPHAGTWIEIKRLIVSSQLNNVVPHAGTWIEIKDIFAMFFCENVVPHAGTWIEIQCILYHKQYKKSFPTRERGLKYHKNN